MELGLNDVCTQPHLGFMQLINLAEEDCLGRKGFVEAEQLLQRYLVVQGSHEKLLPVSKTMGMD